MNKTIVWVLVLIVILLGGWYVLSMNNDADREGVDSDNTDGVTRIEEETSDTDNDSDEEAGVVEVTYSSNGFSPSEVRIPVGGTVVFRDSDTGNMWVASAMHPSHTSYPGSDIDLCGTADEVGIFDQCRAGAEFRFMFEETGTWGYHNHLQASHFGRVIVE